MDRQKKCGKTNLQDSIPADVESAQHKEAGIIGRNTWNWQAHSPGILNENKLKKNQTILKQNK